MNLIDSVELDILTETGDVDYAEQSGIAVRYTCDAISDMLAMMLGLGPDFSAEMYKALG